MITILNWNKDPNWSFRTPRSDGEILQSSNLKTFTSSELKAATKNFSPDTVLGAGGFGSVFKRWTDEHSLTATKPSTSIVIVVKRLNQKGFQGHKEWLAEINYLGQLHHPNFVKLIGYCLEDENRLLVYEFMARASMENHFFRRGLYFLLLPWGIQMKVALSAAKRLAFLHSAKTQVIYCYFKTSNILLDLNYNTKLSDFGLVRDGPTGDRSHVFTRVMGTYGYAAPEYLTTGHLTDKSDIYSFGVVLLEMLSSRRAIDKNRPSEEHNLYSMNLAQKAANLGLQCLATKPKLRPSMDEVKSTQKEHHVNAHNPSNDKLTAYQKPSTLRLSV
ncbi:hypothetical protein ES332_A04G114900v1 [Gossypium tomentosum]|uniref:non-specific serine/threonine protein kinase n=1 Tax=Gossypium tomentosum TaxID=34277 RepID=A0A5D2QXV7_GOSTO|nr:hypothetical protein ES332_A04G114900v1 [Gossypium tomentosum]